MSEEIEVETVDEAVDEPIVEASEETVETSWLDEIEGLDEDHKNFVGGRSPLDLIKFARSQRQAAAKVDGAILLPQPDEDVGDRFKPMAPESVDEYLSIIGKNPDDELTAFERADLEGAMAGHIHKDMYRRQVEGRNERIAAEQEALGAKVAEALMADWGREFEAKKQMIDRAAQTLGNDWIEAMSQPGIHMSAQGQIALMNAMAKIGEFQMEGGPIDIGNAAKGLTIEQELDDLESKAAEQELTNSEKQRMRTLQHKIAEGRANG